MVTMKDVATAAGVSQASVSYAFSGSPRVSAVPREQIFAVAANLGYTGPNIAGSSLRWAASERWVFSFPARCPGVEDPSTMLLVTGHRRGRRTGRRGLTLLPVGRRHPGPSQRPRQASGLAWTGRRSGDACLPDDHPVVDAVLAREYRRWPSTHPGFRSALCDGRPSAGRRRTDESRARPGSSAHWVITDRLGPGAAPGFRALLSGRRGNDPRRSICRERLPVTVRP